MLRDALVSSLPIALLKWSDRVNLYGGTSAMIFTINSQIKLYIFRLSYLQPKI